MALVIITTRQEREIRDNGGAAVTGLEALATLTMLAFTLALVSALASGAFVALALCLPGVLLWVLPLTAARILLDRERKKARRGATVVLLSRLRELTASGALRKPPPGDGLVVWLLKQGMVFNRDGNQGDFVSWKAIGEFRVTQLPNLSSAVYAVELSPKEALKLPARDTWPYYILMGLSMPVQLAVCVARIAAAGWDVVAACTTLACLFFTLFYARLVAEVVRQPRLRLLVPADNLAREELENTLRAFLDRSRSEGRQP